MTVGPVGVLLRHPQGYALLRPDLLAEAQGLPHCARPSVPLHGDLARADALLHRRGGLAVALWRNASRCISSLSPMCRPPGATTRWRRSGARCAPCAASSPARWRSSARRSASAPRSRRIRSCMCRTRTCSRAVVDVDLAEVCITSAATLVDGRRAGRRVPAAGSARRCGRAQSRRGHEMRALMENPHHDRHRSAISRRVAARRPGAARMGSPAQGGGVATPDDQRAQNVSLHGPLTRFGLAVALARLRARSGQQALSAVRL